MRWELTVTSQRHNISDLHFDWPPFRVVVNDSTHCDTSAPKLLAFLDEVALNDTLDRSVPNVLTNLNVDVPMVVKG